ncbi:MAG: hypothetical protein ABSC55_09855 [Syntrophorhabdales bacterium]
MRKEHTLTKNVYNHHLIRVVFLVGNLKAELFPVLPSELEKSKTDYLKTIVSVKPAGDGY